MKKKYIKSLRSIAAIAATGTILSLVSCKKFLTPTPEKSAIQASEAFSTNGSATAAVLGIYTSMMYSGVGTTMANGTLGVLLGLASDELNEYTPIYPDWQSNQVNYTGTSPDYYLWSTAYNYIYECNVAIEGMTASTSLTDSVRQQLLGETSFLRAFTYFLLTNMYGEVPLVTSSDYHVNAALPRMDSAAVYSLIVSDLQQAEKLLSPTYPSDNMVRANSFATQALLARVYLYQGNYPQAEAEADSVIAGPYQLATSLSGVFQNTSPEVIWELLPVSGGSQNAYDFSYYTPASSTSGPTYYLTSTLLNSFEPGDQRATTWVTAYTFNSTTYFYPSKYTSTKSDPPTQFNVVLRLAEQLLIRAEAEARQNQLTAAATDLNAVRNRAGLAPTTAPDQASILAAIAHERQVEFFTEWGQRWFDLKRTGAINATLGSLKPTWTADASLLPIPLNEIGADPNLTQNPGY